ncbi:FecR family protein [Flavivirga rizhaonensis]|uniref:FecR family protein n=2 Tax=Flavivirga rizhaonensis TaxID=2559571 RepID=A0A4S1DVM1_9FLAO|nr:FecR family protein [Flavivirga rizhaonensis]
MYSIEDHQMNKINTNILKLFIAYTSQEISEEEFKTLQNWINKSVENEKKFSEYLIFHKKARSIGFYDNINKEEAWDNIVVQLQNPLLTEKKVPVKRLYWKYIAAASVLLILALTLFLDKKGTPKFVEPIIVNNNIKTGTNKAILSLSDGSNITLEKGQIYEASNIFSSGDHIVYKTDEENLKEEAYNYITIPRGGQFQITLSDGTMVWLNSESQLKYPVNFKAGETRKVELVYGEAYFDVSPSTEHQGADFKVYNNKQEIQVLGTEFNIRAYKDEITIYTTLVEGKVAVSTDTKEETLIPNQQSKVNTIDNDITLSMVDVNSIISWKDGIFDFEGKSLKEIMKVLSRWYDMEVEFENETLKGERFSGRIGKNYKIEEILTTIKNINIIKNYEINNKTVILK